jgi:hypothetical protein
MYQTNEDRSIYLTRGDIAFIKVTAVDGENPYVFKQGDLVTMKVTEKKNCEKVLLEKKFFVTSDTETVEIFLDNNDTKIGETISKPKDYWYEICLDNEFGTQTIIGYDEDGARVFRLYPEGGDYDETNEGGA